MERDLTVGKPITAILKYTLPLFGSIIFQQLYNIADSLVAGRYIGKREHFHFISIFKLQELTERKSVQMIGNGSS